MRLVFVVTRSDAVGGATIHVRDMSERLMTLGHDVTVLVGGQGPVTEQLRARGVPYRRIRALQRAISPLRDLRAAGEIRSALLSLRPDLVSTHTAKAGWLGRLAARTLGIPAIYTPHAWPFSDGVPQLEAWAYLLAEKAAASWASRIVAVCDYERDLALRYKVAAPGKLVTIHNGMPDVAPSLRSDPGRQPPRLVMVARFEPQKDHPTLVDALELVRELPWEAILIGDGPLLAPTAARLSRLGLSGRVRFLDAGSDVALELSRAQAFVLASNWEALPRSILEAMRAGLPVVASDVGGVREAVAQGETGLLAPRGDAAALAGCLGAIVCDPRLRQRFGAAGRDRYAKLFTFDLMFEKTLRLYESVLADHGAAT